MSIFKLIEKSQSVPKKFPKLTVGLMKQILQKENLSDEIEICFEADIPGDYGAFGFFEYKLRNLRDTDNDDSLNIKLVLCGGGEINYVDEEDDEEL